MCGIAGIINLRREPIKGLRKRLEVMNKLLSHRGPDAAGIWVQDNQIAGFAHRRLSIIDLSDAGNQPMQDENGNWIVFNGEIYNYLELRKSLSFKFRTNSDTEVILKAYEKWGKDCVNHLRGMFAFAIWDARKQMLFCARDRFGIKPFYYTIVDDTFYFASEMKALLPFLPAIHTDFAGFRDYLTFQFCLGDKTLFHGVKSLEPAHWMQIDAEGERTIRRYWQIYYQLDWDHTEKYFVEKLEELIENSINYHIKSDVPIGGYVSGGVDSSAIALMASSNLGADHFMGFTGKFSVGEQYDESKYALDAAQQGGFPLRQIDMNCDDFLHYIEKVIYYLDTPVAGPGSFCQYMVSGLAAKYRKVVLGGQGGDEIFGGYTRYLIAYFEQCIKGAIDGTMNSGKYIVTYESIIPNLVSLKNYKPMLKEFWRDGLFDDKDKRYYRLVNRAPGVMDCVREELLGNYQPYETFRKIFYADNVKKTSYFDSMIHFDFKTLLPALLHVEDRMSMAHGLESRVPLLDHELVEFVATIPSNFKLKDGDMKHIFKLVMSKKLPESIRKRQDKMGFPIPLNSWLKNEARDYIHDIFMSKAARERDLIDNAKVLQKIEVESAFARNIWGMLSLELWQRMFHDKEQEYKQLLKNCS